MDLRRPHRAWPLRVPGPDRLSGGELLFVYGTLRRRGAPVPSGPPGRLAAWLEPLARTGATARGRLLDLGGYPGAVELGDPEGEGPAIVGELVAVPSVRLSELDRYEGFDPGDPGGSLFVRERCRVVTADGARRGCWIYRYAGPASGRREVAGGDWLGRGSRDPF